MRSQIIQLRRTLMNTVSHKKYLIFQFYRLPYSTGRFCICCLAFAKDGMLWQKVKIRHREPQPNMYSSMSGVEALTFGFAPALSAVLTYADIFFIATYPPCFIFFHQLQSGWERTASLLKMKSLFCVFLLEEQPTTQNIFHSIFQTS